MIAFQSTLPRGSDSQQFIIVSQRQHFNPRSLAGATGFSNKFMDDLEISIHAPSRERRRTLNCWKQIVSNFNPRSLAGATETANIKADTALFQSTLPRGSDRLAAFAELPAAISIHAPSRERLFALNLWDQKNIFQSTLPRGSDKHVSCEIC